MSAVARNALSLQRTTLRKWQPADLSVIHTLKRSSKSHHPEASFFWTPKKGANRKGLLAKKKARRKTA
jgi:hypothetical protein